MTGITTILPVLLEHPANSAPYDLAIALLLRAVQSVLSQECGVPQELLIVDDGSYPALTTIPALQALLARGEHVRVVRLEKNRGIAYALNAGLTQARHDWIARIDADDFWRPGKLGAQLEALSSDPDLTLIATSMRVLDPRDPSRDCDQIRGCAWDQLPARIAQYVCPIAHGSILARKDVFETLGGYPQDPRFQHCEDFALWSVWMRFFDLRVLDDVLFEWSYSDHQISARFAQQQWQATLLVLKTLTDLGDLGRIPGAIQEISRHLQLPLIETSKLLHTAWKSCDPVVVDPALCAAAQIVFSDRLVHDSRQLPPLGRSFRIGC